MAKHLKSKKVLERLSLGISQREIASTDHMSRKSIRDIVKRAQEKGIAYADISNTDDIDVARMLYPERFEDNLTYTTIDFDYVHEELKKTGVTLKLLWEEYGKDCANNGTVAASYATFSRGYSAYTKTKGVTNHLTHRPAQAMEVDWSGSTMALIDPLTGEVTKAHLFVAVLPYSQYAYAEATLDMKQNTWLQCHINAFNFFGGAAVRIVPYNLKVGVISHPKEGEIVLNEAYEALGRHYLCAIMPTGIAKPKQKASVEGGVGKLATAIIAKLRNDEFTTVGKLNDAIKTKLEEYNSIPFQKREGSRKEIFEEVEKPLLTPLPAVPFEICEWIYGRKVALDFHVAWHTNRYSVPHKLIGEKVDLKITAKSVEIYDEGHRVATHLRFPESVHYKYRTDQTHMPPEFIRPQWDKGRMVGWARSIGPATLCVVEKIFDEADVKEQAYNPVMAVLNLSKAYGDAELEQACAYALEKTARPRCKFIKSVLASKIAAKKNPTPELIEEGGFVRGASYYSGGIQ